MDFQLLIFLTGLGLVLIVLGVAFRPFLILAGLIFVIGGITMLTENVQQTIYFYDQNASKLVSEKISILNSPFDKFVPFTYVFIGISAMLFYLKGDRRGDIRGFRGSSGFRYA